MDCDRRPPPSVIANLMGFDDHQPLQQPIQKRQRVLSENYLQKTASLYISRKRLPSQRCSSMMEVDDAHYNSKDMEKVSVVTSGDQGCTAEYQICVDVKEPSDPEYPYAYNLLHSPRNVPLRARQQSDSVFTCGLQDLRNTSLLPDYVREIKLLKPYIFRDNVEAKLCWNVMKLQQMHKHIPLKPSKGRFSVDPSKQLMIYKGLENEKPCLLFPSEKETTSSAKSFSRNRKHVDSVSPVKGNWIKTHRSLIRPRACCGTNWHLIAEEANKINPSESSLRVSERSSPSVPCISGLVYTNINSAFSTVLHNESVKDRSSTESQIFKSDRKNVFDENNGVCELSHVSSHCLDSGRMKDCHMSLFDQPAAVDNSIKSLARATQTEDSSGGTQIERLDWSPDDISQEASDSLSEDSLATCETSEPLSPTSSEEASRRSPNSVLESVTKGRVPSNINCYKNDSSDLDEGYLEGPGMTVSSDEDNRDESIDTVQDTAEPSDLSYLVSMLDEACGRSDVILHSLENPIDPHVFDILEKKYGRHVSWPRSEKKLLFDRINLGLKDIIKSFIGIQQVSGSVRQRVSPGWTRQEMHENLWRLLVSQDKEAMKVKEISTLKSKDRHIRKGKISNATKRKSVKPSAGDFSCFELEDYMIDIISDLENSLLDELVSEFVYADSL